MFSEIIEVNDSRKAVYGMLSGLYFKELSEEKIDELARLDMRSLCSSDPELLAASVAMSHYLNTEFGDRRKELAVDYAHCFLAAGSYTDKRAVPYESAFSSEDGLLMQDARDDVYRMMCEEHIGITEGLDIPEDHLSFVFSFMVELIDRQNAALLSGDKKRASELFEKQVYLHREHLNNWIDEYCDTLDEVAQTEFYRGVSGLTRRWIHLDGDLLEEIAEIEAS